MLPVKETVKIELRRPRHPKLLRDLALGVIITLLLFGIAGLLGDPLDPR